METIYKYALGMDRTRIQLHEGATVLTVLIDTKTLLPSLWVRVNTKAPMEERIFDIYGTGETLPTPVGAYVGTFQVEDYGWHVFDRTDVFTQSNYVQT